MNKQEFIEKLKMHGAWCTECHDINGKKDIYVKSAKVRELLEQLDELQGEKVEVSREFADWVESVKEDYGNWQSWCVKEVAGMGWGNWLHANRNELDNLPHDGWADEVFRDKEKHIKAIYDGYTVKPKLYIVKNCCGEVFSGFYGGYSVSPRFTKEERYYCDFNDKAKAEAVATLVEGSVEEA